VSLPRRVGALWALVRPTVVWLIASKGTGAAGGTHYAVPEYLQQALSDLARQLGRFPIGYVVAAAAIVLVAASTQPSRGRLMRLMVFTASVTALLVCIFSATWIADPLAGRFVTHIVLLVAICALSANPLPLCRPRALL
jgi:hypothetical protein